MCMYIFPKPGLPVGVLTKNEGIGCLFADLGFPQPLLGLPPKVPPSTDKKIPY